MYYTTKIISASTRMHPFVRNNKRLLRYVNLSDFAVTYLLVDLANKRVQILVLNSLIHLNYETKRISFSTLSPGQFTRYRNARKLQRR